MAKKKAKKNLLVFFLLDETGSMETCKQATISGFNEYLTSLGKRKEEKVQFSLTKFNSSKVDIGELQELDSVKELNDKNYIPNNLTPLYDAIGKTIREHETKVGKKDAVLFVVMTDGFENASREHNQKSIAKLIKSKEDEDWTFVYLGANQDSWANAQPLGMSFGNTINYNVNNTQQTMCTLANATIRYRSAGGGTQDSLYHTDEFFTYEDREETTK